MWAAGVTAVLVAATLTSTASAVHSAGTMCTRAYWSGALPTGASADKPASLQGGVAGHTAEGALVAVHVDASNAYRPTASFFNEHQSVWTSHQAFSNVKCAGAAVGATAAPALGDGAGGDVFALFGGQTPGGEYSKKVLSYSPSSGWTALSPEPAPVAADSKEEAPRGRTGATLTGIGSAQDGTSLYLLMGGVDDEGDFADTWLLTTRGGDATYAWKQLHPSDSVSFKARSEHAAVVWKPVVDATKDDRARVVMFGGCQQQGDSGPACRNDVWIVTVPTKPTARFSMVQVQISEDSTIDAPSPVQGASAVMYKDMLYIYGGCSMATVSSPKVCSTQLRAIDLSAYATSEASLTQPNSGVPAASWTRLQTGTQKHGLAMGGALAVLTRADDANDVDVGSTIMVLGGCVIDRDTGRSVCKADRQNVNLAGVCASECQHGATVTPMGACECTKDFTGKLCADAVPVGNVDCPKDCAGHGTCTSGKCQCAATYGGVDCTQRVCSVEGRMDCSGHGICTTVPNANTPLCVCKGEYHGVVCSERYCSPRDCNGHGVCNTKLGKCDCEPGFGGSGCEKAHMCARNCTGHGACVVMRATLGTDSSSHCECERGWSGKACSQDDRCTLDFGGCGEHGRCLDNECACDEGYIGKQCKDRKCPKQCSGHGECDVESGMCKCMFGFVGDDCAKGLKCPNDCSGKEHGICIPATPGSDSAVGVCKCKKGFRGDDCAKRSCPSSFSSHFANEKNECGGAARGECDGTTGECVCNPAYGGFACEFACPVGKAFRVNEIHPDIEHNDIGRDPIKSPRAQLDAALGACSGHGICLTTLGGDAKCKCEPGTKGAACEEEVSCRVPDCSGNGACFRGKCLCRPGFGGEGCEKEATCQAQDLETGEPIGKPCSGHGKCSLGKCFCNVGYTTPAPGTVGSDETAAVLPAPCSVKEACLDDCSGHGRCHNKECFCATGFTGKACETQNVCKNKCSGHGICFLDRCVCEAGYTGEDCAAIDKKLVTTECDGGCSGRGQCRFGRCFCEPGFTGPNCNSRTDFECPKAQGKTCAGNGECLYNKCFCMPGFAGKACESEAKCPNDCSGHGTCANGFCYCKPPFRGNNCNSTLACKDDCNSRGICLNGKCACVPGFKGETCSFGEAQCPNECSGHGTCEIGRCFCDPSWSGKGCSVRRASKCKNDCSDAGICHNGKCICEPGMIGEDCGTPMPCPKGCRKNGVCVRGTCYCRPGYTGLNCSNADDAEADARRAKAEAIAKGQRAGLQRCPNQCSHNGVCFDGECMCEPGYSGVDCATVDIGNNVCQNDCGAFGGTKKAHGKCWLGKCFCYPGFTGSDCTELVHMPCPTDADGVACSGSGECHYGRCFCDIGFAGKACATHVSCPSDCSGKGTCIRGRCKCETGYAGPSCNSTELVCPNDCSGNGACILGRCACNPGWAGMSCDQKASSIVEGKTERGSVSDAQATELAVGNPDAAVVVPIKQPSIDYTVPQGNSVTQDASIAPNKIKFASSIVPNVKKEIMVKAESNRVLSSVAADLAVEHPSQLDSSKIRSGTNRNVDSDAVIKALHDTRHSHFLQIEEVEMAKGARKPIACTPADCSSRGRCHRGRCFCDPGFGGGGCEMRLPCPGNDCSGNGECANGKCVCAPGFSGKACEIKVACASDCSGHGMCKWGKCFCDIGFTGISCKQETGKSLCPTACNANGLCEAGRCFCKSEYTGHDCSIKVDLRQASALTASVRAQTESAAEPGPQSNRFTMYGALGAAGIAFVVGLAIAVFVQRSRTQSAMESLVKGGTHTSSRVFLENTQMSHSRPFLGDGIDHVGSLGVLEH